MKTKDSLLTFYKAFLLFLLFFTLTISCKNVQENQQSDKTEISSVQDSSEAFKKQNLIIPGKQIVFFKLNESAQPMLDSLDKPDYHDAAMGKAALKWNNVAEILF